MTVYLENNTFKYEIEAVLKLFCPLEHFTFVYGSGQKGSRRIIISVGSRLRVFANINGRQGELTSDKPVTVKETKMELCRLFYRLMSQLTDIYPPWGCLTGIRPVKMVNDLHRQGLSYDEIEELLKDKYFVTDKRAKLAVQTALCQEDALKRLDPDSYSLYISIPFCPSRCSYCSFVSHSIESDSAKRLIVPYTDMLCREIRELGKIMESSSAFCSSVYIGGGTPAVLSAENISKIMKTIAESIDISRIFEYTVEAGRADVITSEKLIAMKEGGADRISVNPQTMNDRVLSAIGRRHSAKQAADALSLARQIGFRAINADLIAGLPADDPAGFRSSLDMLMALSPENITVHALTVKRASELMYSGERFSEEYADEMVSYAYSALSANGYKPYYLYRQKNTIGNLENVGYTKEGFEGYYNIFIMEERQNILACGAGGSSKVICRKTGKINRLLNYKYPYEYISRPDKMEERLSKIREYYLGQPI